jgi:CYTH domain-containing protein
LVSAADGAEQYYTVANNAQRYEQADEAGLQLARDLDKKVIAAWKGHRHLRVINNGEDFERKMQRVLKEISKVLELPSAIEEERKYLVELTGNVQNAIESDISQTYLVADPGCEVRVRRRSWGDGTVVNVHTTRKRVSDSEEIYVERQVENALYESLLQQADPYRHTITKHRKSFIWKGQFFELDTYEGNLDGLVILETKGMVKHEEVKFPPFIKVIEDITGNTNYYNYNLSLK